MKKRESRWGKMMSRDIVVAYIVLTGGLLLNMGIFYALPECDSCTLYSKTGGTLEGNCTYLHNIMSPSIEYNRNYSDRYKEIFNQAVEKVRSEKINITVTCPDCEVCKSNLNKPVECAEPTQCPPCVCEICHKCPSCPDIQEGLTDVENNWLLNHCNLRDGASCYQSGSADTCDNIREYLQVPGRPKFKTRPSTAGWNTPKTRDDLICFTDLGEYSFILNRTPDQNNRTRWGWNDDECKTSVLNIHKL